MFVVKDLTKGIGKKIVLDNVSFDNSDKAGRAVSVLCLVGEKGSGKKSFLRCAGKLSDFQHGEITVNGKKKYSHSFVMKDGDVFTHMTALENLMYGLMISKKLNWAHRHIGQGRAIRQVRATAARSISKFGVSTENFSKPLHTISPAEVYKVAMAKALLSKPQILFCDNPTAGLTNKEMAALAQVIKSVATRHKVKFVISSDDVEFVALVSHKIVGFKYGEIVLNKMTSKKVEEVEEEIVTLCY